MLSRLVFGYRINIICSYINVMGLGFEPSIVVTMEFHYFTTHYCLQRSLSELPIYLVEIGGLEPPTSMLLAMFPHSFTQLLPIELYLFVMSLLVDCITHNLYFVAYREQFEDVPNLSVQNIALSVSLAESIGFEPTDVLPSLVQQTSTLSHSDNFPYYNH